MKKYILMAASALVAVAGAHAVAQINESVNVPEGTVVFRFDKTPGYDIDYRIPAITRVNAGPNAGRLVAIADYRYCKQDIGGGRIDLLMSYSDDNGATWSTPSQLLDVAGNPVAQGTGAPGDTITNLDCGFGDAAIVSDRETGEIFMLGCCGRQNLFRSTRENPQPSARWWSKDGGDTWTAPDYSLWEEIYGLFDGTIPEGKIDGQFVGSGRIMQSSKIKAGDYYRLYAVNSVQNNHGRTMRNYVLYSDDLGRSWHILGDPMVAPVPVNGDEPKAEELPDGSVLLAGRGRRGGRHFNIFRYSDPVKATGRWDESILTNLDNENGIAACNGEIMILPVTDNQDGSEHHLVLQSVPMGPKRENVGIYYKVITDPKDYDQASDFFTGWTGSYQVSDTGSGYSTMALQADDAIGFLYEEEPAPQVYYNIVYKRLPIEQITDGRYSLKK
ncbi:MAG: exo-alpha-sialidase [Bacteroides sp.]|nr:exo-alpha-sialidase [Bacteroides sp.]